MPFKIRDKQTGKVFIVKDRLKQPQQPSGFKRFLQRPELPAEVGQLTGGIAGTALGGPVLGAVGGTIGRIAGREFPRQVEALRKEPIKTLGKFAKDPVFSLVKGIFERKPEELAKLGREIGITAGTEAVFAPLGIGIQKLATKGLKAGQQAFQDLIRAGFTVEKSTIQRVQQKGIVNIFSKKVNPLLGVRNRSEDAFFALGNKIFNSAQNLRQRAGKVVGRWRNFLFKDPRVKVSVVGARNNFQRELRQPTVGLLAETGEALRPTLGIGADTAQSRLLEINNLLSSGNQVTPQVAYQIIDKLDDLVSASKRGAFSLAKNEGRIIANLRRDLKNQIIRSAPRNISKGLSNAEDRFSEVAGVTDDIFDKIPLRRQGVAQKELRGATERNLAKGLQATTSFEERQIYPKLNNLLPQQEKFMELYKDIFAAQDLQREGMGFILRRLLLAPRTAARAIQILQPPLKRTGQVLRATGQAARRLIPPSVVSGFNKFRPEER
jgi:hypothetical protein